MSLQLVFHLELAKPSTITAVWVPEKNRFTVTKITGGGSLILELRKHAAEAGLRPEPFSETSGDRETLEDLSWMVLGHYGASSEIMESTVDKAFAGLFEQLRIEQWSHSGQHRNWGEIRLFMVKPNGENTDAWVWKDNITWVQVIIT